MYVDEDSAIRSPDGTEEEQARNNVKTNEWYMTDVANIHTSRYRYYDTGYHEWTIRVSVTIRFLGTDGPIPVGARSKVWVCGRSLAGIAGSNAAGGMDVSPVFCQVEVFATGRSLVWRRPTMCVCVIECDQVPQ